MFELTTTYSLWWLLPIVSISAMFSALLYFKNNKDDFPNWLRILLFSIRFIIFTTLGVFLLSPMLKSWKTEVEKPIIVVAIDNSQSMIMVGDSNSCATDNKVLISDIIEGLKDKFAVDIFAFGSEVRPSYRPDFKDKYTDFSQCILEIKNKYQYRNIGAMVVVTDGIINRGSNYIYSASGLPFPVYTIGVGDSITHADLSITRVLYNNKVFIDNIFPIEVNVMAKNRKNTDVKVSLYQDNKLISSTIKKVYSDNQLLKALFKVKAKESGLHSYRVVVNSFENEVNTINNVKVVNIDIVGDKKKVIMLYAAPSPDIAALKQVFENSEEFEVENKFIKDFKGHLKDYNLVIFYQFPYANRESFNLVKQAKNDGIPFLITLGTKTDVNYFNSLKLGVNLRAKENYILESTAILNKDFSDFIITKTIKEQIAEFPPLFVPFGQYTYSNYFKPIVYQKLGSVGTRYPLIGISEQNAYRNAFIFGEGLWKWRLMDFQRNKRHKVFDNFIMKLIRYISINKSFRKFDIQYHRRVNQTEPIEFFATFLNDNYEKVNDAEIQMIIRNANGEEFPFAFSKYGEGFKLNAGQFPQGIYSFVAKLNYNGKYFESKGDFVVDAIQLEAVNLQANFNDLRLLSSKTGGAFYTATTKDKLTNDLLNRNDIVDVQKQYLKFKELIKIPWIWFVIIFLIALEWFLRKQMGSY